MVRTRVQRLKAFTAWNHRGELKVDATSHLRYYEPTYRRGAHKAGGSDLRDALSEAIKQNELVKLVEIEPVDPDEDPLRIWAAIPLSGWWRISSFEILEDASFHFRIDQVTQDD